MSVPQLQQDAYDIAYSAMEELFQGEPDELGLCDTFADKWSTDFAAAIAKYVPTCMGLPPGGPITPGPPVTLTLDIYKAMKDALTAIFQGEADDDNLADKFGAATSAVGPAISSYIPSCLTVLGTAPTFVSPGGPVNAPPSTQLVPIFFAAARAAWIASFMDAPDDAGIATKFANKFQDTGKLIGEFMGRCLSLPGGGPIQIIGAAAPSANAATVSQNKAKAQAQKKLAEEQAELAPKIEEEGQKKLAEAEKELKTKANELAKQQAQLAAQIAKGVAEAVLAPIKAAIEIAKAAYDAAKSAYESAKSAYEATKQHIPEANNIKQELAKKEQEIQAKAEEEKFKIQAEADKAKQQAANEAKKAEMKAKAEADKLKSQKK